MCASCHVGRLLCRCPTSSISVSVFSEHIICIKISVVFTCRSTRDCGGRYLGSQAQIYWTCVATMMLLTTGGKSKPSLHQPSMMLAATMSACCMYRPIAEQLAETYSCFLMTVPESRPGKQSALHVPVYHRVSTSCLSSSLCAAGEVLMTTTQPMAQSAAVLLLMPLHPEG